jgi:hypothetical protein
VTVTGLRRATDATATRRPTDAAPESADNPRRARAGAVGGFSDHSEHLRAVPRESHARAGDDADDAPDEPRAMPEPQDSRAAGCDFAGIYRLASDAVAARYLSDIL